MKRRTFITTTAIVGTAIVVTALYRWNKESIRNKHPLIYPLILSSFCDEEMIRKIGISYRTLAPNENSKEKLLELLKKELNITTITDYPEIVDKIEIKVEQEFKKENLLIIQGWVLTQTEARQCALLSFT